MRPWLALALCVLLAACQNTAPITLSVPSDPHILHGEWTGQVKPKHQPNGPSETIKLSAQATYVDAQRYNITGRLFFRGMTYNVVGKGEGYWGATFRPQADERPPALFWGLTLIPQGAGDVPPGSMDGASNPHGSTDQLFYLSVFGNVTEVFGGTLTRVK